jgi:hypothetical protein
MREKVNLFISYIEFFHNLHGKFLNRFSKKMQFLMDQLNADINFEKKEEKKIDEANKPEGRFQKMFQSGAKSVGNALSFIKKSQNKHDKEESNTNYLDENTNNIVNVEKSSETSVDDEDIEMFINKLKEMNSVFYEKNEDHVVLEIIEESHAEHEVVPVVVEQPLVEQREV